MNNPVLQANGSASLYSPSENGHCFACLLRHILGLAAIRPDGKYQAGLFRRQVEFVNNLLAGGNDHLTYDLRIVSHPDSLLPTRGRITVAILCGVNRASREEAERHAAETLRLLEASFEEYEFQFADSEEVKRLLCPFPIRHIIAVSRRSDWRKLDTLNVENSRPKSAGFNSMGARRSNKGSDFKGSVFHTYPFVPSHLSWDTLFKLLLLQAAPVAISCRLRPAILTVEEKAFLEDQIAICERYAQLSLGLVPEDPSSLWPTLREQARMYEQYQWRMLQGLESDAALMTVEIASPESIPVSVAKSVGAAVTDSPGGAMENQAFDGLSGGCEIRTIDLDAARIEAFECLEVMLPSVPGAPLVASRLPHLFGGAEAAACFRLPAPSQEGPAGLTVRPWRPLAPPSQLPERGAVIGETAYRGAPQPVRIGFRDRLRHVYLLGQTGVGKTTALKTMILDDIRSGKGLCVVDPHGDLYRDLLSSIPESRIEDVVLLDPADTDYPVGLNVLENNGESQRHFLVQEMAAIMARMLEDEFGHATLGQYSGPVFFQHMRMNLLLTMSNPQDPGTLLEFYDIFHKGWKRWLPLRIKDPHLEDWVENVLPRTDYLRQTSDGISLGGYISSKFEGFVFDPRLRNIFAQKRSTIHLREIMDTGKVLLVNLAEGELTEANSRFLGMVLLAKLQAAAMGRIKIPEMERREFYVYVDEFQSIATQSFVSLLSEGRKFGLGLVLANQFASQINDRRIIQSAFGNVGTILSFRLGREDAGNMEIEMFPEVSRFDLLNLPNYHAYVKLLLDGQPSRPFSIRTVPAGAPGPENRAQEVRDSSRRKYGRPRRGVEAGIARSLEVPADQPQE